jgi:peptidyl-prolyl cis-trans isomerase C
MMTMKRTVLLLLTLTLAACAKNDASSDSDNALGPGKVATVNGRPLAESVLRVYALANRKNLDDLSAEERGKLLDDLIGLELLRQEADELDLSSSRSVAAQLELQRSQLVARAMITSYLEKNPATETEIKALYEENLPRLSGQQYKARHILLKTKDEADQVIQALRGGKDFLALATEHADGPTGANSDLGWFTADSMVAPVVEAVKTMEVGSYSETPVQSEYGFHVLLLEDSRKQEAPPLESVRDQLVNAIERKRVDEHLKMLRESATVSLGP